MEESGGHHNGVAFVEYKSRTQLQRALRKFALGQEFVVQVFKKPQSKQKQQPQPAGHNSYDSVCKEETPQKENKNIEDSQSTAPPKEEEAKPQQNKGRRGSKGKEKGKAISQTSPIVLVEKDQDGNAPKSEEKQEKKMQPRSRRNGRNNKVPSTTAAKERPKLQFDQAQKPQFAPSRMPFGPDGSRGFAPRG